MPDRRGVLIRRAQKQARRELSSAIDRLLEDLRRTHAAVADAMAAEIVRHVGPDGLIPPQALPALRAYTEQLVGDLGARRVDLLDRGLAEAVLAGARPFEAGGMLMRDALDISDRALRAVRAHVDADGLQLSDRVWRMDRISRDRIRGALETAVVQGQSASQAAADLLRAGEPVPDELVRRAGAAAAERIAAEIRAEVAAGPTYGEALRLFRTEIGRAQGISMHAAADAHPDVIGLRFMLSPNHPKFDICDLHASANLFGLGPGVYPPDKSPFPAHPNTLSYEEVVFADEVTESDRAGQQSRLDWLAEQPPEHVAAILGGRAKVTAFRRGMLPERGITRPWNRLREGMRRRGVDPSQFEG